MTARTVLLTDLPPLIGDLLVDLLGSRPDLKLVRSAVAAGDLAAAASAAKAEVVVMTHREPADLDAIDAKLARAANLSILAIAPDGASAYLHQIRCETSRLEEITPKEILRALAASKPIR